MKKRLVFIAAVFLFATGILLISVDRSTSHIKQSLAAATIKFEVLPEGNSTQSSSAKVDYYLVYPGILPDHPLYKIKMIRDRIWLWLTVDAAEKSQRLLLYADKRLGAGKVLVEGNKVSLGMTTLWKGEKYLDQAADLVLTAKEKGFNINSASEKIKTSSLKHEEILLELKEKVNGEGKTALEEIIGYLQEIQKKTTSF